MGAPELLVLLLIAAFLVVPAWLIYRDLNGRGAHGIAVVGAVLWVGFWPLGLVVWIVAHYKTRSG